MLNGSNNNRQANWKEKCRNNYFFRIQQHSYYHQSWKQKPNNALQGKGCYKCGVDKIHKANAMSHEDYVKEVNLINPSIIKFEPCKLKLAINEKNIPGFDIKLASRSNIKVSTDFDLEAFRKVFKETFN